MANPARHTPRSGLPSAVGTLAHFHCNLNGRIGWRLPYQIVQVGAHRGERRHTRLCPFLHVSQEGHLPLQLHTLSVDTPKFEYPTNTLLCPGAGFQLPLPRPLPGDQSHECPQHHHSFPPIPSPLVGSLHKWHSHRVTGHPGSYLGSSPSCPHLHTQTMSACCLLSMPWLLPAPFLFYFCSFLSRADHHHLLPGGRFS